MTWSAVLITSRWCSISSTVWPASTNRFSDSNSRCSGLAFPTEPQPNYWDFIYFSFVIGMTFQVSDVQVTSTPLRRLVIAHGVISFFFSVAILALAVNLGASLI